MLSYRLDNQGSIYSIGITPCKCYGLENMDLSFHVPYLKYWVPSEENSMKSVLGLNTHLEITFPRQTYST
jgi:hypothetical protein